MKYIKKFKLNESNSQLDQLIEMVEGGQENMAEMLALGLGLADELKRVLKLKYQELIKLAKIDTELSIFSQINELQSLEELDLEGDQLTSLPESIGNLQNLQSLNLRDNNLSELPKTIGNLQNLKYLNLDNNNLSELHKSIGDLQNLNRLILNNNNLSELPKSIGNLQSLEWLYLQNNNLSELPESFGNLQNLKVLDLRYNYDLTYEQIQKLREKLPNCGEIYYLKKSIF